MSTGKYDDILRQAGETLSREEQLEFAHALSQQARSNSSSQQTKSLYEALQARGVIGSITNASADLGTNPKYLEGLGQNGRRRYGCKN
jgi:hypothetical protein